MTHDKTNSVLKKNFKFLFASDYIDDTLVICNKSTKIIGIQSICTFTRKMLLCKQFEYVESINSVTTYTNTHI